MHVSMYYTLHWYPTMYFTIVYLCCLINARVCTLPSSVILILYKLWHHLHVFVPVFQKISIKVITQLNVCRSSWIIIAWIIINWINHAWIIAAWVIKYPFAAENNQSYNRGFWKAYYYTHTAHLYHTPSRQFLVAGLYSARLVSALPAPTQCCSIDA